MPSTSKKQHNLMAAVAHNPAFAKRVGISQDVGKHFMAKDKGRKFAGGGSASGAEESPVGTRQSPEMIKFNKEQAAKQAAEAEATKKSMQKAEAAQQSKLDQQAREASQQQAQQKATTKAYEQASGPDYKRGGSIHKFKVGGHVKPNELEGKAKETKSMAAAEMKALKRGHAPKEVMEHEKAEHKAMGYKKGGHVKKHTKHMRRGGSSAPMGAPRRRANPAALAALMGGAGPAAAPGPVGAGVPGMAHGGGVHHHHHHYYGGGGVEMAHGHGVEKIIKGKSKHGDGAAKKGHTKGTVR